MPEITPVDVLKLNPVGKAVPIEKEVIEPEVVGVKLEIALFKQ